MAAVDYRQLEYVSIEELTTPRDGEVKVNRYWVVHPEHGALFVRRFQGDRYRSPQCNSDKRFVKRLLLGYMYAGHEIRLIETAFLGPGVQGE